MILDSLKNIGLYKNLQPRLARGLDALADSALMSQAPGKYELDGDKLFVMFQEYPTKHLAQCRFESHRKYIDIQFVLSGAEMMGHAFVETLKVVDPYDAAKDVAFYEGEGGLCRVNAGMFAVFFPDDAHMPCVAINHPQPVRKAVFKVAVE
jgi:YhcH/YjgK/YiaL family protein